MNPLDACWAVLKAPVRGGERKEELRRRAEARREELRAKHRTQVAERNQTKLNLGPNMPLPVVGTTKINVHGKEVEVPQNKLGNVPYATYQAALDEGAELRRKIKEAQARNQTSLDNWTEGE